MDPLLALALVMVAIPASVILFFAVRKIHNELRDRPLKFTDIFVILLLISSLGWLIPVVQGSPASNPSPSDIFQAQIGALLWLGVVDATAILGLYGWKTGKL